MRTTRHCTRPRAATWVPPPTSRSTRRVSTLPTTGFDGAVRLWDAATGALRLELPGHDAESWDATFLDDDRLLATVGSDGFGRVWALDIDELIDIAQDKLTRGLTDAECREYLHLDAYPES